MICVPLQTTTAALVVLATAGMITTQAAAFHASTLTPTRQLTPGIMGINTRAFVTSRHAQHHHQHPQAQTQRTGTVRLYDEQNPSSNSAGADNSNIVWSSLANTEKWIQKTLSLSNNNDNNGPASGAMSLGAGSGAASNSNNNPYARKEVSYVCETSDTPYEIVSSIFRRLREMREIGVGHGLAEEELRYAQGSSYRAHTFRQTLMVVIPSCTRMSTSFDTFDTLITAINSSRRQARDYVTDLSLEKLVENEENDDVREGNKKKEKEEWITSVNLAHLHPRFGMSDDKGNGLFFAEEGGTTSTTKVDDEETTKQDAKFRERRNKARRSPYPSVVIEVRSTPPFQNEDEDNDKGRAGRRQQQRSGGGGTSASSSSSSPPTPPPRELSDDDKSVTKDDVKKLEALFGKTAALEKTTTSSSTTTTNDEDVDSSTSSSIMGESASQETSIKEDEKKKKKVKSVDDILWENLMKKSGLEQLTFLSPTDLGQRWIIQNDPNYTPEEEGQGGASASAASTFTAYDTKHVDSAYEFVFTTISMLMKNNNNGNNNNGVGNKRDYLLMPNYLSKSATSFEKWSIQVQTILDSITQQQPPPKVKVTFFHKEHVDVTKRSPVPILVLEWVGN